MNLYRSLAKIFLELNNFFYRLSSRLASKAEKGLHPKKRLTAYHQFFINNINQGDAVLDVGFGDGSLSFDVSKKAKRVVAIDLNEKNLKIAREKYSVPNIEYIMGDATKSLPAENFDVIILSNVLEHIEKRVEFLEKIKNIAPKILIRVPLLDRDWITLYKKELGVEYRSDKTHFTEYTLVSLREELEKAGLRLLDYSIQFGEIWTIVNRF